MAVLTGPRCTCDATAVQTVCCRIGTEPHFIGCPRWGMRLKPRYRLVSATVDGLYYFVNVNSGPGLAREHYSIRRAEFWGKR